MMSEDKLLKAEEDEFEKWWAEQDGIVMSHGKKNLAKRSFIQGANTGIRWMGEAMDRVRREVYHWKANHDNQVKLKAAIASRPDLEERAAMIQRIERELSESKEALRELQEKFKYYLLKHASHDTETGEKGPQA
jgi:predicted RNase H-like nuclease (RuvC/YqgF family)